MSRVRQKFVRFTVLRHTEQEKSIIYIKKKTIFQRYFKLLNHKIFITNF